MGELGSSGQLLPQTGLFPQEPAQPPRGGADGGPAPRLGSRTVPGQPAHIHHLARLVRGRRMSPGPVPRHLPWQWVAGTLSTWASRCGQTGAQQLQARRPGGEGGDGPVCPWRGSVPVRWDGYLGLRVPCTRGRAGVSVPSPV